MCAVLCRAAVHNQILTFHLLMSLKYFVLLLVLFFSVCLSNLDCQCMQILKRFQPFILQHEYGIVFRLFLFHFIQWIVVFSGHSWFPTLHAVVYLIYPFQNFINTQTYKFPVCIQNSTWYQNTNAPPGMKCRFGKKEDNYYISNK